MKRESELGTVGEGMGGVWSFSLGRKQTVHKEGLPLSHFNANESDSVRGVKELSWGRATTATGGHSHTCTCAHTHEQSTNMRACTHAHNGWSGEAQIKSSERLSECQLPLGQRLLCVCAGRRTAFYISFSARTHTHTLFFFFSHTHPPRAAPPG